MKEYMHIAEYCRETGFPVHTMRDYCRSYLAHKFCHRTSDAENAPYIIDTARFKKLLDSGAFRHIT